MERLDEKSNLSAFTMDAWKGSKLKPVKVFCNAIGQRAAPLNTVSLKGRSVVFLSGRKKHDRTLKIPRYENKTIEQASGGIALFNSWTGQVLPSWKEQECENMFTNIAMRLGQFLDANNDQPSLSRFKGLIRCFALDVETEINRPLCDLIGLVLGHDLKQLQGWCSGPVKSSSRTRMFFHILSKIVESRVYQRDGNEHLQRIRNFVEAPDPKALADLTDKQKRAEFLQLSLALLLAEAAFVYNDRLKYAKETLNKLTKSTAFTTESSLPLADQILADREMISNMDYTQKFPTFVKEARKAEGASGVGNFCPLEQKNLPDYVGRTSVSYSSRDVLSRYSTTPDAGNETKINQVVHRLRVPSPTRDPDEVLGAFKLFLDYCYANKLVFRYTNLQSQGGVEGTRWEAIRAIADHDRYKKCFVMLGLSMDASCFPKEGEPDRGWDHCIEELIKNLDTAQTDCRSLTTEKPTGYYFPLRQIKELFQARWGVELDFDLVKAHAIEAARKQLAPAVSSDRLSVAQQIVFRQTVFSNIERIVDTLLGVTFVSDVCKDNQDRGPTQAMLSKYYDLLKAQTPSSYRPDFRAHVHGPALFNKGDPILLKDVHGVKRAEILADVLRQKQPNATERQQIQDELGFQTLSVAFGLKPSVPPRVKREIEDDSPTTVSPRVTKRARPSSE